MFIETDDSDFRRDFNRVSFAVRHNLANHPLFELPRLARVAEAMLKQGDPDRFVALGARRTTTDTKSSVMPKRAALADTVRNLDEAGTWMKLSHAHEVDPEYRELMDLLVLDLEQHLGQSLRKEISWCMLTVFLASPRIVTPYHIDHESNFLLQVRGAKDVCLFDGLDRSILSVDEIERFYSGNAEAARYSDALATRGTVYHLVPGLGVHHPPLAPHWVRNGDAVSVSVSISFCLRHFDRDARIHQANLVLRRLGMHPPATAKNMFAEQAKVAAMRMMSASNPRSRNEMLFSGVRRLGSLAATVRRFRPGAVL